MRTRSKEKDISPSSKHGLQNVELEKELTKALDKSSSKLSQQLDEIVERFKHKGQTEHTA